MGPHWTGILIVAILLLVLFGGRGKISAIMGDFAKGVTAFRKGLRDDDGETSEKDRAALGDTAERATDPAREDERNNS
jgi:sec-independent protein translocase protein TatA